MLKRSFHSAAAIGLVLAGCLLIASTYGLARFGVGLLHPAMADEQPGLRSSLAAAGAAQFVSYCLAAGAALVLATRRPRFVAGAAGVVAATGCLGLATSGTSGWFVGSAFVAGAGAGLASPALVVLLDRVVPTRWAGTAQAVGNAGTAVGVVAVGTVALAGHAPVAAWLAAAAACLVSGGAVALLGRRGTRRADVPRALPGSRPALGRLVVPTAVAFAAGAGSAAVWTHGPTVVLDHGGLPPDRAGLLWIALGVGGLLGAAVDLLVRRWGPATTFAGCCAVLAGSSAAVLLPGPSSVPVLGGAAAFGAAYMALSGTLILWGRRLDPARGGHLTAWLFVALAVGQAGGSLAWGPLLG